MAEFNYLVHGGLLFAAGLFLGLVGALLVTRGSRKKIRQLEKELKQNKGSSRSAGAAATATVTQLDTAKQREPAPEVVPDTPRVAERVAGYSDSTTKETKTAVPDLDAQPVSKSTPFESDVRVQPDSTPVPRLDRVHAEDRVGAPPAPSEPPRISLTQDAAPRRTRDIQADGSAHPVPDLSTPTQTSDKGRVDPILRQPEDDRPAFESSKTKPIDFSEPRDRETVTRNLRKALLTGGTLAGVDDDSEVPEEEPTGA